MLKRLAILAVFILAGFALFGIAQTLSGGGVTKSNSASDSDPAGSTSKKPQLAENQPANALPANSGSPSSDNKNVAAQSNEDREIAKYTKYLFWAGILQAVVLFGTLIAIFWQARLMRVQAYLMQEHAGHLHDLACAARDNANAALSQAELMKRQMDTIIHKDRARLSLAAQPITIEGEESGFFRLSTSIELTNTGQTNAYIIFSAGRFVVTPSGRWPLPQPDPDEFFLPHPFNIVKNAADPIYASFFFDDAPLDFGDFAEKFAGGELKAFLYGFIEYESLGIKRHRDFGYIWTTDTSNENFTPQGLEEMITAGWWEQDLIQKNGEYEINEN